MDGTNHAKEFELLFSTCDITVPDSLSELTSLICSFDDQDDKDLALKKLAIALSAKGKWAESMELVSQIAEPYESASALNGIADEMVSLEMVEEAKIVLKKSLKNIDMLTERWQKAELLNQIARSFSRAKAEHEAEQMWNQAVAVVRLGEESDSIQDKVDGSSVLA